MQNPQSFQQKMQHRLISEYRKTIMSWDKNLIEWRKCIKLITPVTSLREFSVSRETYKEILALRNKQTGEGVNLLVIQAVCNAFEATDPHTLNITEEKYIEILDNNAEVAKRWGLMTAPISERIIQEMNSKPLIHQVQNPLAKA